MRSQDKFRGSLIGGAAGDALGYAVEFWKEPRIFSEYGPSGISSYELNGDLARISDDTQMTLFTANGLLLATTRGKTRGIMGSYESYIREMYKCWYKTQVSYYTPAEPDEYLYSWLLNVHELYSRRAPGNTCMSALASDVKGSVEDPINNSKGCGGVMRVAPIGLYFADDPNISIDESDMIGAEAAAITHGHDLGYIPAAALVHIIRKICEDPSISVKDAVLDSVTAMQRLFPDAPHISDFTDLMNKVVKLALSDKADLDAIHALGEGWVAEETLAIAAFCAIRYQDDVDKALTVSVNHNGDSDSTGAVTGNILGAFIGYDAIPAKYKEHLELQAIILELADDLFNDCRLSGDWDPIETPEDKIWEAKYIMTNYKPDVVN